jgi:hypothetical protein
MSSISTASAKPFLSVDLEGVTKSLNLSNAKEEGQLGNLRIVTANENSVVLQTGDPKNPKDGFEITITTDGTVRYVNNATGQGGEAYGDPHWRTVKENVDGALVKAKKNQFDMKQDCTINLAPGLSIELEMVKSKEGKFYVKEAAVHQSFDGDNNDTTVRIKGVEPSSVGKTKFMAEIWGVNGEVQNAQSNAGVMYAANANGTLKVLANGEYSLATKTLVEGAEKAYVKSSAAKANAGADELLTNAAAEGPPKISKLAADGLKKLMGDKSVQDVLGSGVDYSKMSWQAVLFAVMGKLLNDQSNKLKDRASKLGAKTADGSKEAEKANGAGDTKAADGEKKADGKDDQELQRALLNQESQEMQALVTLFDSLKQLFKTTNDKMLGF